MISLAVGQSCLCIYSHSSFFRCYSATAHKPDRDEYVVPVRTRRVCGDHQRVPSQLAGRDARPLSPGMPALSPKLSSFCRLEPRQEKAEMKNTRLAYMHCVCCDRSVLSQRHTNKNIPLRDSHLSRFCDLNESQVQIVHSILSIVYAPCLWSLWSHSSEFNNSWHSATEIKLGYKTVLMNRFLTKLFRTSNLEIVNACQACLARICKCFVEQFHSLLSSR